MKKAVVVLLICAFSTTFVTPLALAQDKSSAYQKGYRAGKRDGRKGVNQIAEWFWGVLFGGISVLATVIGGSSVPAGRIMVVQDKSEAYKKGYRRGYLEAVNNSTLSSRLWGWSTWLLVAFIGSQS